MRKRVVAHRRKLGIAAPPAAPPRAWAEVTVGPYSAHEFDACVGHYVKRGVLPAHQGPKTFDARRLKMLTASNPRHIQKTCEMREVFAFRSLW